MTTSKFGRYEIKSEIGRGGMATVYHAYDPVFERDVAIKVLPKIFLHDPQFRTRFEREAKMIALLEHPAIVPVYDFGQESEQPFIVMRYMAGGSLADRIKAGPLSCEETSRTISRLAPALDAAHARGIVHRDLKPGNILFDQYGNACLSDFGIAHLTQEGSATLTGGNVLGTPAYMSPEQVQSDKKIDGRSDLYALGVLTYQMLTGQMPFQADTPAKVMMMHVLEPVPHLSEHISGLPGDLDQVISKAMAKNTADRYATASELASALEAAISGQLPTRAVQPSDFQPAAYARSELDSSAETLVAPAKATPTERGLPLQPALPSQPALEPAARKKPFPALAIPLILAACLVLAAAGALVLLGQRGVGPLAMLSAARTTPTVTAPAVSPSVTASPPSPQPTVTTVVVVLPTATPQPVDASPTLPPTSTSTPAAPVLGGADKVAFISGRELWIANLDGSLLSKLTSDGSFKTNLQWTADGKSILYLQGNCVQMLEVESGRADTITCLTASGDLKAFELSPDGRQAAISINNQLYIVPLDVQRLQKARSVADLRDMAECKAFAPYQRNLVKMARWSRDSQVLAAELIGNLGGRQGDIIQLFRVDSCLENPQILDNFPPPRFEMKGYSANPTIPSYSWDGEALFALNSNVRNDGFGDLSIYNTVLHKARSEVNPVESRCCYRDPTWSPDGSYLLFAFQDIRQGANSLTELFYIPVGTIGSGAQYKPMPLPAISDPREKPYPALRPAQ